MQRHKRIFLFVLSTFVFIMLAGIAFSKIGLFEGKLFLKEIKKDYIDEIRSSKMNKSSFPNTSDSPVSSIDDISQVFPDPISVFTSCPSQSEKNKIERDFDFHWYDPVPSTYLHWADYPYSCDFTTDYPTRLKTYNVIRFIDSINFTKPLPFTDGKSLYEFLTLQTISANQNITTSRLWVEPRLECDQLSMGYNFVTTLSGNFTRWYPVVSGSSLCQKATLPTNSHYLINNFIYHPLPAAELFLHETHHAITNSLHTEVNGGDSAIDEMGAWAAQFYFDAWVALYSTNTDQNTKNIAKDSASAILTTRFSNPCPTETELKSIVNQIRPNTCP